MSNESIDDLDDIISSVIKKRQSDEPVVETKQETVIDENKEKTTPVKTTVEILEEPKIIDEPKNNRQDRARTINDVMIYCDLERLDYDQASITGSSIIVFEPVPGGMFALYKLKMGINSNDLQLQAIGNDRVLVKIKETYTTGSYLTDEYFNHFGC